MELICRSIKNRFRQTAPAMSQYNSPLISGVDTFITGIVTNMNGLP